MEQLPVIREEIGDTWIHGIASDPLKVRKLKQLMRLRIKWIKEGRLPADGQEYVTFMENLLFVCEHTWALDYKKHLFDFKNWAKEDFQQARVFDEVTEELFTQRNTALKRLVCEEKNTSHLTGSLWKMCVMGETILPMDVVRGGNRRQHCVEKMSYDGADGSIEILNLDSPLVSMGGRRLYGRCRELPDMTKGFSYCLFNNKWGTNFPMWCEDDGCGHACKYRILCI